VETRERPQMDTVSIEDNANVTQNEGEVEQPCKAIEAVIPEVRNAGSEEN